MDKIDDLITATVVTSSLQPGGAPKRALHSSIKSALKLAKLTMNKYYSRTDESNIYRIAMGEFAQSSHTLILELTVIAVLHPNYKLEYFRARKWEKGWIETAQGLVRDEFDLNYASRAGSDNGISDGDAVCSSVHR
jgi:hypothetical protein